MALVDRWREIVKQITRWMHEDEDTLRTTHTFHDTIVYTIYDIPLHSIAYKRTDSMEPHESAIQQEEGAVVKMETQDETACEEKEAQMRERLKAKAESRKKESPLDNNNNNNDSNNDNNNDNYNGSISRRSQDRSTSSRRRRHDADDNDNNQGRESHPPRRRGSDYRSHSPGEGPYRPYHPPAMMRGGPSAPPQHWRGPPGPRGGGGRGGPPPPGGGRPRYPRDESYRRRSRRSRSRSRSRSRGDKKERRHGRSRRSRSRSVSSRSSYSDSDSDSSSSSGSSSTGSSSGSSVASSSAGAKEDTTFTKDQRTVFCNQLVMRATERDLRKFFRSKGCKVNEVIFLNDRRTGRHKGCAYVELRKMSQVPTAVALSGEAPDFQRFPILIKASEAEKNHGTNSTATIATATAAAATTTAATHATLTAAQVVGKPVPSGPIVGPGGKLVEAQKVYVGSLDPNVTHEHLFALFSPLGQLEKVVVQIDSSTGTSKGFAFLSFRDPKEANLAIQTMATQVLAGRPMKTGWATHQASSSIPGVQAVTSAEFPADAAERTANAYQVLAQLTSGAPVSVVPPAPGAMMPTSSAAHPVAATGVPRVGTVAEARATLAAASMAATAAVQPGQGVPTQAAVVAGSTAMPTMTVPGAVDATKVGNADHPTKNVLVHNMYNKDVETDKGWADEIRTEFQEECSKFGTIVKVTVMSELPGGKIYASFDSVTGAQSCASSLAGRWFDKRQLRAEFVMDEALPTEVR